MKIMNKNFYFLFVLLLFVPKLHAQQEVMFTQYMFNPMALNPAYAGSHESVSITGLVREQWVGLEGAPSTQTFSIHSPTSNRKVALGLGIINDRLGVSRRTKLNLNYAYRIFFPKRKATLSFGLRSSLVNYATQFSKLRVRQVGDINFENNDLSKLLVNFGAGLYYYTDRYYVGFAVPKLLTNKLSKTSSSFAREQRHYYLRGGLVFPLGDAFKLRPHFVMKATEGAPLEFDINANLLIKEVLWLGVSYRTGDSFAALLELQILDQLRIGYSYDFYTVTDLSKVQQGSHEISINYRLRYSKHKVITPRYF